MIKQIRVSLFLIGLGILFLIGCGADLTPTPPIPTRLSVSTGGNRTVIARPVATDAPDVTDTPAIEVEITGEPGETAAPSGTDEPNAPPQDTPVTSGGDATPEPPAVPPTPLPTANIVRPLLPTPAPTGGTAPTSQPKQVGIGTPITLGDAVVTVTGIQSSQGGQGDLPRSGDEYVIVSLTLENKGAKSLTFDASQFSVRTADGKVVDYEDVTFQDNVLRTTNLQPNEKKDVSVVFDIPKGATGLTLVLGDPSSGGVASVHLN